MDIGLSLFMGIIKLVGAAVGAGLKGASAISNKIHLKGLFNIVPLSYKTEDGIEHHYCFVPVIEKNLGNEYTLLFLGDIDDDRAELISLALISGAEHAYIEIFKNGKEKELAKGKIRILEENPMKEEFEEFYKFGVYLFSQVVRSRAIRENLSKRFKNVDYSPDTFAYIPIASKNFVGYTFFKYEAKSFTGIKQVLVPRIGISQIWKKRYIINRPDINKMITDWFNIKNDKKAKKKRNEISSFAKNLIKNEISPLS